MPQNDSKQLKYLFIIEFTHFFPFSQDKDQTALLKRLQYGRIELRHLTTIIIINQVVSGFLEATPVKAVRVFNESFSRVRP